MSATVEHERGFIKLIPTRFLGVGAGAGTSLSQ